MKQPLIADANDRNKYHNLKSLTQQNNIRSLYSMQLNLDRWNEHFHYPKVIQVVLNSYNNESMK